MRSKGAKVVWYVPKHVIGCLEEKFPFHNLSAERNNKNFTFDSTTRSFLNRIPQRDAPIYAACTNLTKNALPPNIFNFFLFFERPLIGGYIYIY